MPPFLAYIFPLVFLGIFPFVLFILSRLGWHSLSQGFSYPEDFKGKAIDIMSARINWVNYNGVLSFKYNDEGLYISPVFIFKLFHPPVLIPWSEISKATTYKFLFIEQVKLTIGVHESTRIIIPKRGFNKIQAFLSHLDSEL